MPVKVMCDSCGARFTAEDKDAGKRTKCLKCGAEIVIPTEEDVAFRQELDELARAGEASMSEQEQAAEEREQSGTEESAGAEEQREAAPEDRPEEAEGPDAYVPEFEVPATESGMEPPSAPAPEPPREEAPPAAVSEGKSRYVRVLQILATLAVALALIEAFQVLRGIVDQPRAPLADLHAVVANVQARAKAVPGNVANIATLLRPETAKRWGLVDKVLLAGALVILAVRMFIKSKLLESVCLTSTRAHRRTMVSAIFHFVLFMGLLIYLTGTTALIKSGTEVTVCTLVGLFLLATSVWLIIVHFQIGGDHPHVAWWTVSNALFGLLILLVTVGDLRVILPVSRAGATTLLLLFNSALSFCIGSRYFFESEEAGTAGRRIAFLVVTFLLVILLGGAMVVAG